MDPTKAMTEIAIHLEWAQIWIPSLLLVAFQVLLAYWIKSRLEQSIKHEYDTKLETFRFELRVREQAAGVAELLAEVRYGGPTVTPERAKTLNRMAWELSLWLPADTVRELTGLFCFAEGSKDLKEILIDVRKHILGNPKDDLRPEEIVHFDKQG